MRARQTHLRTSLLAVALALPLATGVAGCRGCQRGSSKQPPAKAGTAQSTDPDSPALSADRPTPEATDREGAQDQANEQLSFRQRSVYEMEKTLGQPLRVRQDAINAAYLRAGWAAGTDPTTAQDHRAYAQALAWGFDIRSFLRHGRKAPFSIEELADHPLEPMVVLAQDRTAAEPPTLPPDAPQDLDDEPARAKLALSAQEIARIQRSLADLDQSVAQIEEQIEWAQQQLRSGAGKRSAHALRELLLSLEQRLHDARSDAARQQRAIDQLSATAD